MADVRIDPEKLRAYLDSKEREKELEVRLDAQRKETERHFADLPEELRIALGPVTASSTTRRRLLTGEQLLDAAKAHAAARNGVTVKELSRYLRTLPAAGSSPRVYGFLAWWRSPEAKLMSVGKDGVVKFN